MFKTLADPVFNSIINKGELTMNDIICDTTEEHNHAPQPSTTLITSSPHVDSVSTVQGVSGATYAPMDTSPKTPEQDQNARVKMLMDMLTTTLNQLVKELQTPSQPQTDLEEAVSTTLEQADWFRERLNDEVLEAVDEKDFDYEIGNHIERYFRNQFDPSDHFDIEEAVKDRVVDEVESIIDGLVEEAVEARLADLLEEKLQNANISISF
jgi:DNA primase